MLKPKECAARGCTNPVPRPLMSVCAEHHVPDAPATVGTHCCACGVRSDEMLGREDDDCFFCPTCFETLIPPDPTRGIRNPEYEIWKRGLVARGLEARARSEATAGTAGDETGDDFGRGPFVVVRPD